MKRLVALCAALLVAWTAASADPAVFSAQKKLKAMGYYRGELDGAYGSQTAAAIRRYQLAENLQVTGQLNAQTREKLGIRTRDR